MSNTQGPAYRSGIWEIRENTITAHLPEGDMVLTPADIEFIRLQSGFESGLSYCDAFIRVKGDSHSYPAGRSASAQDDLCKVLGQFAYWNKVELIRPTTEPAKPDGQPVTEAIPQLSIPAPAKVRRPSVSMPKSPDSAYQTMRAPDSTSAHGTGTGSNGTTSPSGWTSAESHPEAGQQQSGTTPPPSFNGQSSGFTPPPGSNGQPSGFTPPPGFNGQPSGFTPPPGFNGQQPEYGPQQDFRNQMPWWQWAFHPANPNFYKTIIAVALARLRSSRRRHFRRSAWRPHVFRQLAGHHRLHHLLKTNETEKGGKAESKGKRRRPVHPGTDNPDGRNPGKARPETGTDKAHRNSLNRQTSQALRILHGNRETP